MEMEKTADATSVRPPSRAPALMSPRAARLAQGALLPEKTQSAMTGTGKLPLTLCDWRHADGGSLRQVDHARHVGR
eukprot:scaffold21360_cov112-Isochrysis_galbana.AAC.1